MLQARRDLFRLFKYDMVNATKDSSHNVPLLLKRHHVVPGMFLVSNIRIKAIQTLSKPWLDFNACHFKHIGLRQRYIIKFHPFRLCDPVTNVYHDQYFFINCQG